MFRRPTSQAPSPAGGGSGLDTGGNTQTELPVLMRLTLRAVVLNAGAVRSLRGHRAGWTWVWFSQSWGRACSWPPLGGGTVTANTQDRRPQGVTQPQTSGEPRQRSTALGRDSRADEQGKPTMARRCRELRSQPHARRQADESRLSQHSKHEAASGVHAPGPETPRHAAHLALNQATDGPRPLRADVQGPQSARCSLHRRPQGPRRNGPDPCPRDPQASRGHTLGVWHPGHLQTVCSSAGGLARSPRCNMGTLVGLWGQMGPGRMTGSVRVTGVMVHSGGGGGHGRFWNTERREC